jgi:DNA-binding response OmpR family regulator
MTADRTIRILVSEHNPADRTFIELAFAECGYSCELVLARSREDAKAKLVAETFDLMVSDFGIDLNCATEFIRSARRLAPAMPIIVMSSVSDPTPAYVAGANAFIRKEGEVDLYFAKVRTLMLFWTRIVELPEPVSPESKGRARRA